MITTVVFDMDGVLCRYRRERRLALLSEWSGLAPEAVWARLFTSGLEDEAERGLLSADEYLAAWRERLGYDLTEEEWVAARRSGIEPDHAVLALADGLRSSFRVGMLTNNPFLLKRHFATVFPEAAAVMGERAVFSAELGASKPSPEAFRRLCIRLEVAPDEVLYLDDDATYVAGAREAGLHSHAAAAEEAVRDALAAFGIG